MFLTRFRVNTARPDGRRLLASPQRMHAAVMSSFPELLPSSPSDRGNQDGPRVLWRLDRNSPAEVLLYVVSPDRPDLTHLVEQAGWPAAAASGSLGWKTYDYGSFLGRLDKGGIWNFRLTANPVHSVRNRDDAPTKLTAHLNARHQLGWLLQRQEAAGFRLVQKSEERRHTERGDEYQVVVRDQRDLNFGKREASGGGGRTGRVTLKLVTYDGRLEVTDPEALRRVLTQGLGRAKAYGGGLMTLAPAG
ncbi:type I-E CRISPR-associated protein Cas6/Cse3/CasE [Streptomyces sp. NBC_00564]|uniref:type I-E CRISPR-associated protein Cas6/Cse3/CasE n=1 Tax=Streptomyces sp. NBC_00564 TaxID=2903663 RepID=UPI00352E08DE|nr:type I-E CRISPR-associated protein Cas6/Cse3/CasE [Streptomyces sp. NBC_00564]